MQTNVLEYLENTVERVPDKTAFADEEHSLTFREVSERSKKTGSILLKENISREPVIIYMKKSPEMLTAFFGVLYAGCYYVPVDEEMPFHRIELILENTQAGCLIYDEAMEGQLEKLNFQGKVLKYEECIQQEDIQEEKLLEVRKTTLDTDPIYVLFTSGSTGVPKGVVGHHRAVIDYIDSLSEALGFSEDSIFGNQTPFYLDACMKEVYSTLKFGATTYLIPKKYFMFPIDLVKFLNTYRINTVCWVVSALTMISAFGTFEEVVPKYLKTVAFGSEVFPIKQFNLWKRTLPEAEFYNLYGPTEATGMSCYYHADHLFEENDMIPIGKPFKNTEILLLDQDGKKVNRGEQGEICIRGTCLTHGYYHNPEKTAECFVQNPNNPYYPEKIYKTGDLAYQNEQGDLVFLSRKDDQIKHMGHRIELGEIEADTNLVEGVQSCCCIYLKETGKIALFYTGNIEKREVLVQLKKRLPRYMIPNAVFQLDRLPLTPNGKMDRLKMKELYREQKK